jgi:hypothetical protein
VGIFAAPVLAGVYVGRIIFDGIATVKKFVIACYFLGALESREKFGSPFSGLNH